VLGSNTSFREGVRSFLYVLILCFLVWLALLSSLHLQEVLVGLLASVVISFFLSSYYHGLGLPPLSAKRIVFSFLYVGILFWEIVKANFDVAYRVLHPRMPINPGVVVIRTRLKSDLARMILANSITLTPGTFTLDVSEDTLLIHWINVQTEDIEEATSLVGERFEKYLRVIFQ